MSRLKGWQLMIVAIVGMILTATLIALGHNHFLNTLFLSLNGLALGGGVIQEIRKKGENGG